MKDNLPDLEKALKRMNDAMAAYMAVGMGIDEMIRISGDDVELLGLVRDGLRGYANDIDNKIKTLVEQN